MPDEVNPPPAPAPQQEEADPVLPESWQKKIPQRAHPVARQLLDMSGKDRAKILRAFGKEPVPPDQLRAQTQMVTASYTQTQIWHGPIPPASELAKFNEIAPGSAATLIQMAVKQQTHRMELEKFAVTNQIKQSGRGQIFAFILGLAGLGAGVALSMTGHAVVGGFIGSGGIFTLAGTFITGKWQEKKDREKKDIPEPPTQSREGGAAPPISSASSEQGTLQI